MSHVGVCSSGTQNPRTLKVPTATDMGASLSEPRRAINAASTHRNRASSALPVTEIGCRRARAFNCRTTSVAGRDGAHHGQNPCRCPCSLLTSICSAAAALACMNIVCVRVPYCSQLEKECSPRGWQATAAANNMKTVEMSAAHPDFKASTSQRSKFSLSIHRIDIMLASRDLLEISRSWNS